MDKNATWTKITAVNGGLKLETPYNEEVITAIKQLPASDRSWDKNARAWVVAPKHGDKLVKMCKDILGVTVTLPATNTRPIVERKLIRLEYIGQLKERTGEIDETALGLVGDNWSVIFTKKVLRAWIQGSKITDTPLTFYNLLAIKNTVTQEEIKSAWRKMVKRYHPDVNSDDDAHIMTQKINDAYSILKDPLTRRKYDAGLVLADSYNIKPFKRIAEDITLPVRCGWLLVSGTQIAGRFRVNEILQWEDIVENGLTLVTSWNKITNKLRKEWV